MVVTTSATTIATVGEYRISSDELYEEMTRLDADERTFEQLRSQALQKLINEYLVIHYAVESGITIDSSELESYFISVFRDHPRFMTEGYFDYEKFEKQKNLPEVKAILEDMRRELLLEKARTLITNSLGITDDRLMELFILENAQIDISYATVDIEAANVEPHYSTRRAMEYYRKNRENFTSDPQRSFRFFIIPADEFVAEIQPELDEIVTTELDSIITAWALPDTVEIDEHIVQTHRDSIRAHYEDKLTRQKALETAYNMRLRMQHDAFVPYATLHSDLLYPHEQCGNLPVEVTKVAFELEENEYSEPIELPFGYLVMEIDEVVEPDVEDLENVKDEVWQAYCEYERNQIDLYDYYLRNIDTFIIPAAVVSLFELTEPRHRYSSKRENMIDQIKKEIKEVMPDDNQLARVIHSYGIEKENKIIFLDLFSNIDNHLAEQIADKVKADLHYGFIESNGETYFFKLVSYFPEYIPNFHLIEDQLSGMIEVGDFTEIDYEEYYEKNKADFMTVDSLQLGGAYIPINPDTIRIDSARIREIYESDRESYYRDQSVKFDYIYTTSKKIADNIGDYIQSGVDFELLRMIYSEKNLLPKNMVTPLDFLPIELRNKLKSANPWQVLPAIELDEGWIVARKLEQYPAGIMDYEVVKDQISSILQYEIADSIAVHTAQEIFEYSRYISSVNQFRDRAVVFRTSMQAADEPFEYIGSIAHIRSDLMRLWRNEKYSSILPVEDGYAVIFLVEKRPSRQMTYEEALPRIKAILRENEMLENARDYVSQIRDRIIASEDADQLLFFLGGWQSATSLSLDSKLPGVELSSLILDDVIKRETGYVSPIITMPDGVLMFYRVDKMERIASHRFEEQREAFRKEVIAQEFQNWLDAYRDKVSVQIYD
jgi:hypothetical protein